MKYLLVYRDGDIDAETGCMVKDMSPAKYSEFIESESFDGDSQLVAILPLSKVKKCIK